MSRDRIRAIREAFRVLFAGPTNLDMAVRRVEAEGPVTEDVAYLLDFIRASTRGMAMGPRRRGADDDEAPE